MFWIFFEGLLLGFGAAVPIGPVNILIMNEALRSYRAAVAVGLGAMTADIFYLSAAALGLAPVLQIPWVQTLLGFAGMLFLALLGIMLLRHRDDDTASEPSEAANDSLTKAFLSGLMLTLANPYTVGFWLSVMAVGLQGSPALLISGLVCAIVLWVTAMPWVVHRQRHRLGPGVRRQLNTAAAGILLLFALLLLAGSFR
jgi:L-lysine exporter family protein LysE/ArgO